MELKPSNFFLIGNQKTIINEKKGKVQDVHDDEHQEKIEQTAQQQKSNQETKLRESINSVIEEQSVKPQQRDHSKRLRWHKSFNSPNVFSMSSKERRFRSNHTIHIKHSGTKFQMSELRFPSH